MFANNFLGTGPPLFNGENYQVWVIKMKAYLKALNLWEAVENDTDPAPLGDDPTIAQLKNYEEQKAKKPRALTCLHSALSKTIFLSVIACETPKEIWEKLREEYEGSQRVKNVKLLTLKREFEMHKMKEGETVKEYARKLMEIVNKIKLFGESFPDSEIVEKMLISLPATFEPKISAIEESCDLTRLTVTELISKLHAQEQRTNLRDDETVEAQDPIPISTITQIQDPPTPNCILISLNPFEQLSNLDTKDPLNLPKPLPRAPRDNYSNVKSKRAATNQKSKGK
ncbi:hypothetical protein F0562_008835 [Nyssa sinensis]|uniref:Uncharacterized protein n=1 Tax=Nyssa sinensis TaxID=561372 RepID=A0A5J5AB20_9ASTE|nr:hypothetical protein F0562_008835 [Nyssa sinensis]